MTPLKEVARQPRRRCLAWLAAGVFGPARAQPATEEDASAPGSARLRQLMQARRSGLDPDAAQRRQALLAQGWRQLEQGDNDAALASFDEAALLLHAADSELALVRTYLQRGEYQRAIAFGAHTAGAHRDVPEAAVLYAWLLQLGGLGGFASRLLDDALQRRPDDDLLHETAQALRQAPLHRGPRLRAAGLRLGPLPQGEPVPAGARALATAVALGPGGTALLPLVALPGAGAAPAGPPRLWLRDGLGRTVRVRQVQPLADLPLAVASTGDACPCAALPWAARDAFPGSPVHVLDHAGNPEPASWPQLVAGFLGAASDAGEPLLGPALPAGPRGGPVLDRQGRLVGLALAHADGRDRLLPVSRLRAHLAAPEPVAAAGGTLGLAELYERALPVTLQVLAELA